MKQEVISRLKLIYGIIFGVTSLAVVAALIYQVCDIYFNAEGQFAFSRQIVAEHFKAISALFYTWVAFIAVGFILWEVFPQTEKKRGLQDVHYVLYRSKKRLYGRCCGEDGEIAEVASFERLRSNLKFLCVCCCVICSAVALGYLFDGDNFANANVNREVVEAVSVVLPCTAVAFLICIGVYYYDRHIAKKELELIKKIASANVGFVKNDTCRQCRIKALLCNPKTVWIIRGAVAVAGVVFVVLGITNRGVYDVLAKAVNICTECIGLG